MLYLSAIILPDYNGWLVPWTKIGNRERMVIILAAGQSIFTIENTQSELYKIIDFALDASADYIISDARGGDTGAAPLIFRDNISVPTIPAASCTSTSGRKNDLPELCLDDVTSWKREMSDLSAVKLAGGVS